MQVCSVVSVLRDCHKRRGQHHWVTLLIAVKRLESLSAQEGQHRTCAVLQGTDEQQVHSSADCTYSDPYIAWQTVGQICGSCYQCACQHDENCSLHEAMSLIWLMQYDEAERFCKGHDEVKGLHHSPCMTCLETCGT